MEDDKSVDAAATDTLESEIADILDFEPEQTPEPEVEVEVDPQVEVEGPAADGTAPDDDHVEGPPEGSVDESTSSEPVDTTPPPAEPPPPSDEVTLLKEQVAQLTALVSQLSTPKDEPKEEPKLNLSIDELITQTDFDEIMEDKDKFMGFLKSALESVAQSTSGYVQGVVPQVVNTHLGMQEMREAFYRDNPELDPVRPYVANVASNIARENPEWEVTKVLNEAARVAKETLRLTNIPTQNAPPAPAAPPPTLPGSGGSRRAAPQKTPLQQEIDEILEDY